MDTYSWILPWPQASKEDFLSLTMLWLPHHHDSTISPPAASTNKPDENN